MLEKTTTVKRPRSSLIAMNSNWFYFAQTVNDDACYIGATLCMTKQLPRLSHAHLSCVNSCLNCMLKLIQNVSKVEVRREYL